MGKGGRGTGMDDEEMKKRMITDQSIPNQRNYGACPRLA